MRYYTVAQLAKASGLKVRSIRHHVKQGWLKAEPKAPGVRGSRFREVNARKWLSIHFPAAKLP